MDKALTELQMRNTNHICLIRGKAGFVGSMNAKSMRYANDKSMTRFLIYSSHCYMSITDTKGDNNILVNLEADDHGLGGFLIAVIDQLAGILLIGSRLGRMIAVAASALRVACGLDLGIGVTVRRGF